MNYVFQKCVSKVATMTRGKRNVENDVATEFENRVTERSAYQCESNCYLIVKNTVFEYLVRRFESIPVDSTINLKAIGRYARSRSASDFGASFVISGLLAIVFKTTTAPLERIKLILQTQASSRQIGKSERSAYSGFLDALLRIPREQGFLSLWRGNFLNICRYFPSQAINFSFYDLYYDAFHQTLQGYNLLPFLAGGAVGVTSCTLVYPLTFCTTRISVDVGDDRTMKREFHNLNDCLRKVYKCDGYRGFYQGLSFSATGMCLYRSVYFGVYTLGKRAYWNDSALDSHTANAPFLVSLALAQLASIVATMVSYPLDTIAKQKMLWSGRGTAGYASSRRLLHTIARKDGPMGFYRGVFANLLTTVCGSLILVTYDLIKERYEKRKAAKVVREVPGFRGR